MKYNLDCIRDVLLTLELCLNITIKKHDDGVWEYERNEMNIKQVCENINPPNEPKYRPEEIAYSVEKLKEAGFISVIEDENNPLTLLRIVSITYEGHEFLEKIKSPKNFDVLKERLAKAGCWALSFAAPVAQTVGMDFLMGKIQEFIK